MLALVASRHSVSVPRRSRVAAAAVRERLGRGDLARGVTPAWFMLAVAVLLSLCWQACVVQTHIHLDRPIASNGGEAPHAGAQADSALRKPAGSPAAPLSCPLCHELAHAGPYLVPDAIAFVAPPFRSSAPPRTRMLADAGSSRPSTRNNRGPPPASSPR